MQASHSYKIDAMPHFSVMSTHISAHMFDHTIRLVVMINNASAIITIAKPYAAIFL